MRDVAAAITASLAPGRGPRRYVVAGHNHQFRSLIKRAGAAGGENLWSIRVPDAAALSAGRLADAMRGTTGLDPALAYEAPWLVANGHLQTTPARGRSSASSFGRSTRRLPIPSVGSASPGTSDRAVRYAPIDILSRRPMPAWPLAEFGLNVSRIEGYA